MNKQEFETEMNRLRSVFGDRSYPDERLIIIWREVKEMSGHWWKRSVDDWIGQSRQAPFMTEIGAALSQEKAINRSSAKREEAFDAKYGCEFCSDLGVYLCLHSTLPGKWSFRCHCQSGINHTSRKIPQFKSEHLTDYVFYERQRY